MDTRRCGDCTACCQLMDRLKAELGKDRRPCGCRPFPGRTAGCEGFVCLWLDGFGGVDDRPDKLGLVFKGITEAGDNPIAIVWETRFGAAAEPRALDRVRRVAAHLPTIVLQRPPEAGCARVAPRPRARGRLEMLADRLPRRRGGR